MHVLLALLFAAPVLLPACAEEGVQEPVPAPVVPAPAPASPKPIVREGIRIYPAEHYLELDAFVCLDRGLLELYACSPGGKTHESMLVVKAKPQLLHFGLILLGLKEGQGCTVQGDAKHLPRGEPVDLFVEWEEGGKTWRARAEDLVYNVHKKSGMEKGTWVFTGSQFVKGQDPNTGQEVDIYLANATGTVITTFRDPASVLDNASEFSADDTSYFVNEPVVPARGTPVRLLAMAKGQGPAARREVILPALSPENAKKAEELLGEALLHWETQATHAKAASDLAALGRPVLAPVRSRLEAAEEVFQKARAAMEASPDLAGLDPAAKAAKINEDKGLQALAESHAAVNALYAEVRQLLATPPPTPENPTAPQTPAPGATP